MRLAIPAVLFSVCILAVHAEDLTTRDGSVYRNYRVVSSDPGYVTILYNDGGGRVPLSQLPADLQREYHYDPATAAAYTRQFEAEDRHERIAVQLAQSNPLAESTPGTDSTLAAFAPSTAAPSADAQPAPAPAPDAEQAAAPPVASSSGNMPGSTKDFDPGDDPLQPDADILSHDSSSDSGNFQGSDFSYYAAYDNSGGLWVSSYDPAGNMHWYRWDRKGNDHHDHLVRLDGSRDLPPNALVTLDRSGQWVITYIDSNGIAQRFYRSPSELHADPGAGAWRVVLNGDGSRSLCREGEEQNPPHDFHHYAYADQGPAHENRASTYHGFAGPVRYGTSYSSSIVMGSNVHVGGQMGNGMAPPRSYGGDTHGVVSGAQGGTTIVHVTPAPSSSTTTVVRTH